MTVYDFAKKCMADPEFNRGGIVKNERKYLDAALKASDFYFKRDLDRLLRRAGGVPREKVDRAIEIISEHSKQRKEIVPSTASYGIGVTTAYPLEVTVGGATIFVIDVERFEKV